ncbi:MAG: NAD(P)H-hydrate dehydratase [Oscillospiraceae bacterium]
MYLLTPQKMKELEALSDKHGVSYSALMQNAGEQLAEQIYSLPVDLSYGIVFFCGSGNNGGDGFVAARLLASGGYPVTVVLMCGEPATELSARAYVELGESSAEVLTLYDNNEKIFSKLSSASLIVDAVFGTGFHGELPPQVKACFSFAARSAAKKLAVDVASGGDCTDGKVSEGILKCDYTVTFAYEKIGMRMYPLCDYSGEVRVVDIGIDKALCKNVTPIIETDDDFIKRLIPARNRYTHKGDFGKLINIAGSKKMPGAAALSTMSALRSGAGLVTLATPRTVAESLSGNIYECTYLPLKETTAGTISATNEKDILTLCESATAVSIGCGMGVNDDCLKIIEAIIKNVSCPVIIDADGINCIATRIDILKDKKAEVIVTPHPKELSRLLGISVKEVMENRFSLVKKLSEEYGITVLSKGMPTIVCGSNGYSFINENGNAGLSRGGSGDVLTGIIASLAAQGLSGTDAAAAGAYIFGKAADITADELSMQGMLPSDVIKRLPFVFKEIGR